MILSGKAGKRVNVHKIKITAMGVVVNVQPRPAMLRIFVTIQRSDRAVTANRPEETCST